MTEGGSLDDLFSELELEFKKKDEKKIETAQTTTPNTTQTKLPTTPEPQSTQETIASATIPKETVKVEPATTPELKLQVEPKLASKVEGSQTEEAKEQPTTVNSESQSIQKTVTTPTQVQVPKVEEPKPRVSVAVGIVPTPPKKEEEKKPGDALASIFGGSESSSGVSPSELVFEVEPPEPKEVWLIAGEKDDGKTHAAFSFIHRKGTNLIVAIAFDTKTARVWWNAYNGDPRIVVIPAYQWFTYKNRDEITRAAAETYRKLIVFLDGLRTGVPVRVPVKKSDGSYEVREIVIKEPDWIIIDNTEVFMRIAEFTARYNWKLPPFAGAEWKLWDERNYYIRELFFKAFESAKRGVIYTTYVKTDDVLIEDGRVVRRKESPKWVEAIKYETDFVVRVRKDTTSRKYFAEIVGSKDDNLLPCGTTYDITDIGLWLAIEQKRFKTT